MRRGLVLLWMCSSILLGVERAPAASDFRAVRNSDGSVTLSWAAEAGSRHLVEVSEDLANWRVVTAPALLAAGAPLTWTDDGSATGQMPAAAPRRCYRLRSYAPFTFVPTSGNLYTYTDASRAVSMLLRKPAGSGPFPAVIIDHGTGGNLGGFTNARANELLPWGLVCIGPGLTHSDANSAGYNPDQGTWGYSAENSARQQACLAVLASLGYVDMNRVTMWGHSRGSFLIAGMASEFGAQVRAVGMSAGGVLEDADEGNPDTDPGYPYVHQVQGVRAPFIMFHGEADVVVPPVNSLRYQGILTGLGVPNSRVTYPGKGHGDMFGDAATKNDMLAKYRAWLQLHGVLPAP